MGNVPLETDTEGTPELPSVRLASIDLHPQADGRLVLSLAFTPAASELLRSLGLAASDKARPPRKEPKVKTASRRAKKPPSNLLSAALDWLDGSAG